MITSRIHLILVVATLWLSADAWAETTECPSYIPAELRTNPHELAMRGVACFEAKDYLQALIFYREAYGVSKSTLLQGAIGRSLQELGLPDLAREYYKSYLLVQAPGSEGHQKIRDRLDILDKSLADQSTEVELRSAPSGATAYVVLGGKYWEELGTTPLKVRLLPGDYRIVIRKDDYVTVETDLKIVPGQKPQLFEQELISQNALFGSTNRKWRQAGVIVMLASIPIIAASPTLFLLSESEQETANRYKPDNPNFDAAQQSKSNLNADRLRTAGIITGGVGVATLLTGLTFYLIGVDSAHDPTAPTAYLTPRGVGVILPFW